MFRNIPTWMDEIAIKKKIDINPLPSMKLYIPTETG